MTFTQINALLMVIECGGFTEAGKRLYMTQSAISQSISTLEEELGILILVRGRRQNITLTPVGERIVSHLHQVKHEINSVNEIVEQEKHSPLRLLRIGCFPSICACILPKIIDYFEFKYPRIRIIPYEANSTEIIDLLHQDEIDVGFAHSPTQGLYSLPVYKDKFAVVVPKNHHFIQQGHVQLEELFKEPLIASTGGYESSIMLLFKEFNITPKIKYEFNHPSTAISFVQQKLGIALLPELLLKTLDISLQSVTLEPSFHRQISLISKHPPIENSFMLLLSKCLYHLISNEEI